MVSYISGGLDSTVVYPTTDLKLSNPYDFPVVMHYQVNQGSVKVELLGHERPNRVVRFRHSAGRYRSGGLWLGLPEPWRWGKEESDPVLARCRTAGEFIEAVGQPEWHETTIGPGTAAPGGWGRRGSWSWSSTTQAW